MGDSVLQSEVSNKSDSTSSSGGSSSSGTSGNTDTNSGSGFKPEDSPVASNTGATSSNSGNPTSGNNESSADQAKERSLGAEQSPQEEKATPDYLEIARQATERAMSRYPLLTDEQKAEVRNGLTGFAMSGIAIDDSKISQVVKNVAPVEHAIAQFKEQMSGIVSAGTHTPELNVFVSLGKAVQEVGQPQIARQTGFSFT